MRARPAPAPPPGTVIRVRAPAKVNLLLRILGRRADGFHELETLFQAVDLCDTLTLTVTADERFRLAVTDEAGDPVDVGPVEENLVTRALDGFRNRLGRNGASTPAVPGLGVHLVKRIPAGAGLGGGSSDAGAFLRTLNGLLGDPLDPDALAAVGAALGADVAFFAGTAGRAVGRDRGETLAPGPVLPRRTLVVGLPPVHVDTGRAYARLARSREGGTVPPRVLDDLLGALAAGAGGGPGAGEADGWATLARRAVNDFEPVVAEPDPAISDALAALRAGPSDPALLSGSGAAVFGVLPPEADAEEELAGLRRRVPGIRWLAVATLDRLPAPERVVRDGEFT